MQKGETSAFNVIVGAAIALVILIIVVGIFTGNLGNWVKKFTEFVGIAGGESTENSCWKQGYQCVYGSCPNGTNEKTRAGGWIDCVGGACCGK
ncbi:hypothetical protein HY837_05540 [archaeon]|nr:hypothetical protein [archaeon]